MRAFSRHLFPIAGTFLFAVAPMWAQEAPAPAPAAAPRSTQTWTTFKGDPQRTGSSTANVKLPLSLQWRYSSDAPPRTYVTSPLVVGAAGRQRIIFGAGPNVIALDPQTGAEAWRSPDFTSNVVTPLTLFSTDEGDFILAAQQRGRVVALRSADGKPAWERDTLSSISASGPIIANTARGTRIIIALSSGRLIALNPKDGSIDTEWEVPLGRFGITPTSSMSLSSDGRLIFLCGSDAKLYAVDADQGSLAYSFQLAANSAVTPVVAGDQLITCNNRRVSGNKAQGGTAIWNFDPRGEVIGSPAVSTNADGTKSIFFGTRNGLFYALDNTGAQLWKTEVGAGITGTPIVLPSMVLVGTTNGLLVGFSPSNGTVIWQYRMRTERAPVANNQTGRGGRGGGRGGRGGGGLTTPPSTANQRTWPISAAPTAVDGQLYVLGDNAALYSFTTQAYDAAPPRIFEPSIAAPDDQSKIAAAILKTDPPQLLPGRGPIYFAAELDDSGSGVDPKSIQVTLDGAPLPAESVDFQIDKGILTATLLDPTKGGTNFPDGLKNLTVTATDYAGNKLNYSVSFLIDNTAPPLSSRTPGRGGGGWGDRGGGGWGDRGGRDGGIPGQDPDGGDFIDNGEGGAFPGGPPNGGDDFGF